MKEPNDILTFTDFHLVIYHFSRSPRPKYGDVSVKYKLVSVKSFQEITNNLHVTKLERFKVYCLFLSFKNAFYDMTSKLQFQCASSTLQCLANN